MSAFLVKASNIGFSRSGVEILSDVSLEVGAGDFISVVGPNGAGKTTLVKVLTGVLLPDSGMCERRPGLNIGYMPQKIERMRYMPISAGRFIGLTRKHGSAMLEEVCAEAGAGDILDRQMGDLSGGEIQRVLLARALMNNPDLIVLDEPAQNLDVSGQLEFYKLLETIHRRRNSAILMVSHDLHMVMSCTKKVVCLYRHICCAGEPKVVAKNPEFAAMFGGDMARLMSVYSHAHEHTHGQCADEQGGAP